MADETIQPAMSRTMRARDLRLTTPRRDILGSRTLPTSLRADALIRERGKPTVPSAATTSVPTAAPGPTRPLPAVPSAPATNPFEELPFPSPGDRIKADDFKKLSQGLRTIYDSYLLSGALFGSDFGQAKRVLASQGYEIRKVLTVFGAVIEDLADESLDHRKVIQVVPLELGQRQVAVALTEAVETRRFAPNLLGLTYREASERLQAILGEITFPTSPMAASPLVGLLLKEAKQALSE